MEVCFVGFVDGFSGTGAPFLGGVAMHGHDFDEVKYDVMRGLTYEFDYFIGYGIRAGGLSR